MANPRVLILGKSDISSQNVGGSNGTEVWWTWDVQCNIDFGFVHDTETDPSHIQINMDCWAEIIFIGAAQQGGSGRTSLQGIFRINGGTTQRKGTIRNYSRGVNYGNLSPALITLVRLVPGDYIEVGTRVDDSDGVYVINTSGNELNEDESILTIKLL